MWGYEEYPFNTTKNYFVSLLSLRYSVIIDKASPDLLIYSVFGLDHLNYNCLKICFSGENIPNANPLIKVDHDPSECNLFLGKYPDSFNTIYMPLWVIFINWFGEEQPQPLPSNPTFHVQPNLLLNSKARIDQLITQKRGKCCFINNNEIYDRVKLYLMLSSRIDVDSYGKLYNNQPGGIALRGSERDKLDVLEKYWLTIAFENSYYPGYNTEKIIHPFAVGCIPFYNGGLDIRTFNSESLFFLPNYRSYGHMIDSALSTISSRSSLLRKLSEPLFVDNKIPDRFLPQAVLSSICDRIDLDSVATRR